MTSDQKTATYDPKDPSTLNYAIRWIERAGQKLKSQTFARDLKEANATAKAAKRKGFTEVEVIHKLGVARRMGWPL